MRTERSAFNVLLFRSHEIVRLKHLCALYGFINSTCKRPVPRCSRLNKCIFHFILVGQWIEIADCDFTSTYLKTRVLLLSIVNSNSRSTSHFMFLVEHRVKDLTTTFSNWKGGCFISCSVITTSNSWKLSLSKSVLKLWPMFFR
jgi:hypothetical protein